MYKDCELANHKIDILGKVASWKTVQDKRIKGIVKWQVQTEKNIKKKKMNKKMYIRKC